MEKRCQTKMHLNRSLDSIRIGYGVSTLRIKPNYFLFYQTTFCPNFDLIFSGVEIVEWHFLIGVLWGNIYEYIVATLRIKTNPIISLSIKWHSSVFFNPVGENYTTQMTLLSPFLQVSTVSKGIFWFEYSDKTFTNT